RHTRFSRDWSSDVCSYDLDAENPSIRPVRPIEAREHAKLIAISLVKTILAELRGSIARHPRGLGQGKPCGDPSITRQRIGYDSRSEERRVGKDGRWRGWRS